jgi:dihydropteroate synthase
MVNKEDADHKNFQKAPLQKESSFRLGGDLFIIDRPMVMGIVNVTPDSFYDGGKNVLLPAVFEKLKADGADIIDIGGYSTRPGASDVQTEEEWSRLKPALECAAKYSPGIPLSVDTFRAEIVKRVLSDFGPVIVNDITSGTGDSEMFRTAGEHSLPYIAMHMQGTPATMQINPEYHHVTKEIIGFFAEKVRALRNAGVHDIMIDPGFGFGKTLEHNYELLRNLSDFQIFDLPVLVGLSRKSMIYKLLGGTPEDALAGSLAVQSIALSKGALILRTHDVAEAKDLIRVFGVLNNFDR